MSCQHVLFTLADEACGKFLLKHWAPSILDNVDLSNIEVVVLDYGMNDAQKRQTESFGFEIRTCVRDGFVGTICLRDIATFLCQRSYDQVVAIDGGDVIFQADISHLFEENKDSFRAALEDQDASMHRFLVPKRDDFSKDTWAKIMHSIRGKQMINGSMLFAPARKYQELWRSYEQQCQGVRIYGSDQMFINYHVYNDEFEPLDWQYNFVICSMSRKFDIRDGVFFDQNDNVIPVVHNAGGAEKNRYVANFGYGSRFNQKKRWTPILRHSLGLAARLVNRLVT